MAKKKPSLRTTKLRAIAADAAGDVAPAKSEQLRRTTVMIPEWQLIALEEKKLEHRRARETVTVSAMIREAIDAYLTAARISVSPGEFGVDADAFMSGMKRDQSKKEIRAQTHRLRDQAKRSKR